MNYYDQSAQGYNELHGEEQKKKVAVIKKHLSLKKSDRLLDVGCGTGLSSDFDCDVVGIDPSIELLKQNKAANSIHAAAESLPFKDNSFDVVISVTAVHNFSNIARGLEEIKRVGKNTFVLSILKKSPQFKTIQEQIHHLFSVTRTDETEHDTIFFCASTEQS